jgi:hypothetical protein
MEDSPTNLKCQNGTSSGQLMPVRRIEQAILVIHGRRVMLSTDLAALYGVPVYRLNEQVKRNRGRFPEDFMFQLSPGEWSHLKSQIAISSWGGVRHAPYAFTERGVAMLSSVLRSKRAVQVTTANCAGGACTNAESARLEWVIRKNLTPVRRPEQ